MYIACVHALTGSCGIAASFSKDLADLPARRASRKFVRVRNVGGLRWAHLTKAVKSIKVPVHSIEQLC